MIRQKSKHHMIGIKMEEGLNKFGKSLYNYISLPINIKMFMLLVYMSLCFTVTLQEGTTNNMKLLNETSNDSTTLPPQEDVITSCQAFIERFSEMASNFTRCSIRNARPVKFCEHCIKDYVAAKSIFSTIMKGMTEDSPDLPCGKMILNSDRLQIIVQTARFIDKVWTDGNCINCFDFYDTINNTEVAYQVANDTQRFQYLSNLTWNCFVNNSQASVLPFPPTNVTANMTVCENCRAYYESTNTFYVNLEAKYSHQVCMDLVDSMNYTRILWSQTFKCSRPKEDIVGVMILSALFCSTPIIFYVASKIYGSRMEHRILEQKRLKNDQRASTSRFEPQQDSSH